MKKRSVVLSRSLTMNILKVEYERGRADAFKEALRMVKSVIRAVKKGKNK